jgi:hypothetical protein
LSLADRSYSDAGVAEDSNASARLSAAGESSARASHSFEAPRDSKIVEEEVKPLASASSKRDTTEDEVQEFGFAHPAISRPPRTVWLPKDALGLSAEEEKGCREAGVNASVSNATMDEKGKVDITGAPPDAKEY